MKYLQLGLLLIVLVGVGLIANELRQETNVGSVVQGNEYNATTTGESAELVDLQLIKGGYGTLGQVTITGAAAGDIFLYDATTSDATLRTKTGVATTTRLIAHIPQSAAAGTYTFDAIFFEGLLFDVIGTQPTTTILYR